MAVKNLERAITFETNEEGDVLTFRSAYGAVTRIALDKLSPEARRAGLAFGVARKVTNAAALDAGASIEDKWEAVLAVAERLQAGGEWNAPGKAKGERGATGGMLAEAFRRVYGDDVARTEATIARTMEKKGLTRAKAVAFWSGTDKIAEALAAIKIERATKAAAGTGLNADEELAAMRGD